MSASHPIGDNRQVEFLEVLGRGGFGAVYLADLHGRDGFVQRVAVKVLNAQMSESADIAARQRDEARLLARLNHDHIVKVFDLTEVWERPSVIMEYVEGVDLGLLVREGPLPTKVALQAISQASSALHAAWESPDPRTGQPLRVVHRDIKPSNLLLSRHGGLKVLDFGIARGDFDREGATGSVQFGTSRFMAPEQWLYRAVSDKVDVYALGVTFIELLAGAALERAPLDPERFATHMGAAVRAVVDPQLPAHIRTGLSRLCTRMLAFEPRDRPSAAEVHELSLALADELGGEGLGRYARRVVPPIVTERRANVEPDPLLSKPPDTWADSATPALTPIHNLEAVTPADDRAPTLPFAGETPLDPTHVEPEPPPPVPRGPAVVGAVIGFFGLLAVAGLIYSIAIPTPAPVEPPPLTRTTRAPAEAPPPEAPPPEAPPPEAPPPEAPVEPTSKPPEPTPTRARPPKPSAEAPVEAPPEQPPAEPAPPPVEAAPPAAPPPDDTPAAIALTFTSSPIGARVTVGSRTLPGTTPIQVSLPRGRHTLRIEKDGQACADTVSISPLSARTFRCDLSSSSLRALR